MLFVRAHGAADKTDFNSALDSLDSLKIQDPLISIPSQLGDDRKHSSSLFFSFVFPLFSAPGLLLHFLIFPIYIWSFNSIWFDNFSDSQSSSKTYVKSIRLTWISS